MISISVFYICEQENVKDGNDLKEKEKKVAQCTSIRWVPPSENREMYPHTSNLTLTVTTTITHTNTRYIHFTSSRVVSYLISYHYHKLHHVRYLSLNGTLRNIPQKPSPNKHYQHQWTPHITHSTYLIPYHISKTTY